jgi:hypothetical protein
MMIFTFYPYPDIIPDVGEAELISGRTSIHFNGSEYLIIQNGEEKRAFKINYEFDFSPFKDATVIDNLLLVGHGQHFYLYDLQTKRSVLVLKVFGYFGAIYIDKDHFFVTDAEGIFCIDMNGVIVWESKNLGIDGVSIEKITENEVYGGADWDPPDGRWVDFVLDKRTGKAI